jgi:FkbM family methyltransferase
MTLTQFRAEIPLVLDCPEPMRSAVEYVLEGEYESGHDGASLDILDLGANIGSFALWANMRWPNSRIRCYEPNPGTFAYLQRNAAHLPNVMAFNVAVFPGTKAREPFFARYDGDGEAGLARYAGDTFTETAMQPAIEVDVVDPGKLTSADIVKMTSRVVRRRSWPRWICPILRWCWPSFRTGATGWPCKKRWRFRGHSRRRRKDFVRGRLNWSIAEPPMWTAAVVQARRRRGAAAMTSRRHKGVPTHRRRAIRR